MSDAAREVLHRLTALGACIECRGERLVLRAGAFPVPKPLVDLARATKAHLRRLLAAAAAPEEAAGTLRCSTAGELSTLSESRGNPTLSPKVLNCARVEHLRRVEHLSSGADGAADMPPPLNQSDHSPPPPPAPAAASMERPTWGEAEDERAAIIEHDGMIPRAWAEGFARLDADRPPGDMPPQRWQRFVDDVGRFFDGPFCAAAAALGWGPYDLFGCDRDRPLARIDRAGLLWFLNGDRLVALSEHTATIETPTGARRTFRRRPTEPDRVLA